MSYCTSGMIVAAVALLAEKLNPTDADIVAGMNRNVCRCGRSQDHRSRPSGSGTCVGGAAMSTREFAPDIDDITASQSDQSEPERTGLSRRAFLNALVPGCSSR